MRTSSVSARAAPVVQRMVAANAAQNAETRMEPNLPVGPAVRRRPLLYARAASGRMELPWRPAGSVYGGGAPSPGGPDSPGADRSIAMKTSPVPPAHHPRSVL